MCLDVRLRFGFGETPLTLSFYRVSNVHPNTKCMRHYIPLRTISGRNDIEEYLEIRC